MPITRTYTVQALTAYGVDFVSVALAEQASDSMATQTVSLVLSKEEAATFEVHDVVELTLTPAAGG